MCRKVRARSAASAVSLTVNSHRERDQGEGHDQRDDGQVGAARRADATVDALLNGDRHGHPAAHLDQRQRDRPGQAGPQLRGEREATPDGGERALVPVEHRPAGNGGGHALTSSSTSSACSYAVTRSR
jgi:hypothetical protein